MSALQWLLVFLGPALIAGGFTAVVAPQVPDFFGRRTARFADGWAQVRFVGPAQRTAVAW